MKKIFYLFSIAILVGCGVNKKNISIAEKTYSHITGIYMSEEVPADIGQPYRVYLNLSNDSVWIANFSSECAMVQQMSKNNYHNKTTINHGRQLNFSFENIRLSFVENQEVEKKYKVIYKGIHQSPDSLIFEVSNYWFDGQLFYQTQQIYYPCK